jgi:hypothetical protein
MSKTYSFKVNLPKKVPESKFQLQILISQHNAFANGLHVLDTVTVKVDLSIAARKKAEFEVILKHTFYKSTYGGVSRSCS